MNQRKNLAKPHGAQPQSHAPVQKPASVQRQVAPSALRQPPAAPPAYRPQPVPKVLQQNKAGAQQQQGVSQSRHQPVAPPAYRPQPAPVVSQQQKTRHSGASQGCGCGKKAKIHAGVSHEHSRIPNHRAGAVQGKSPLPVALPMLRSLSIQRSTEVIKPIHDLGLDKQKGSERLAKAIEKGDLNLSEACIELAKLMNRQDLLPSVSPHTKTGQGTSGTQHDVRNANIAIKFKDDVLDAFNKKYKTNFTSCVDALDYLKKQLKQGSKDEKEEKVYVPPPKPKPFTPSKKEEHKSALEEWKKKKAQAYNRQFGSMKKKPTKEEQSTWEKQWEQQNPRPKK